MMIAYLMIEASRFRKSPQVMDYDSCFGFGPGPVDLPRYHDPLGRCGPGPCGPVWALVSLASEDPNAVEPPDAMYIQTYVYIYIYTYMTCVIEQFPIWRSPSSASNATSQMSGSTCVCTIATRKPLTSCSTANMSAVWHGKHVCCVTQAIGRHQKAKIVL